MANLRTRLLIALAVPHILAASLTFAQDSTEASMVSNVAPTADAGGGVAVLKIALRLPDEMAFVGQATVRVLPDHGDELLGIPAEERGEFLFSGVRSGKYLVFVSAPGYQPMNFSTQIESGPRQKTLFVPMNPKAGEPPELPIETSEQPPAAAASRAEATAPKEALAVPLVSTGRDFWNPHELREAVPAVEPGVACPVEGLLRGVGERASEFVSTLEKFTATEKVEHYAVDRSGTRKAPKRRSFVYVATVSRSATGMLMVDEYRDGSTDETEMPAHITMRGSPAMALVFHPQLAGGFDFQCEGLGQWDARQAWQVHFVQRADRPVRIRSYTVRGRSEPMALEGRVWIDPGSYQILRLESELAKSIPVIQLTHEHFTIDYKPMEFRSTGQQVWLPQTVELYVEVHGKRYYRRHSFSDFRLFNVDVAQNIQAPRESFSFTNTTDRDVAGKLTVTRRDGLNGDPVVLDFVVPARGKVFKIVGTGRDINIPVSEVSAAVFLHNGEAAAVKVDTHLTKETSLDVVPQTPVAQQP
jgi:hypothetical protein